MELARHLFRTHRPSGPALALALAAPGLVALLWEPARWLVGTWTDPSYESDGWIAALLAGLLLLRSALSGPAAPDPAARSSALALLLGTAALRLVGRLLAIGVLGAAALALDVAAVALLVRVRHRPVALSPGAVAALFAFSLPLENLLQRLLGHPLQLVAAATAASVLSPFFPGLARAGTLLSLPGLELAIDLPCSGARGLSLLGLLAALLACRRSVGPASAALLALAAAGGALLANSTRIVLLFCGTAASLPVLAEPWHSALGLVGLVLGALPLLAAAARAPLLAPLPVPTGPAPEQRRPLWLAAAFSAAALAVAAAPHRPVDVASRATPAPLALALGPWIGERLQPSPQERAYFERFGGSVQKLRYDDGIGPTRTALVVRTTAPLRHLHGPDACLIGAGHEVLRLGVRPGAIPTVVYRSTAPDGTRFRVEASYLGPRGQAASSVSEVVWRWLEEPASAWSLVERISPWDECETSPSRCVDFDRALFDSLANEPATLVASQETSP